MVRGSVMTYFQYFQGFCFNLVAIMYTVKIELKLVFKYIGYFLPSHYLFYTHISEG